MYFTYFLNNHNYMRNKIKQLRECHGVSQTYIAKLVNKSSQTVMNWENEVTNISIEDAIIIADFFNCSLDELFYHHVKNQYSHAKDFLEDFLKKSIFVYIDEYLKSNNYKDE